MRQQCPQLVIDSAGTAGYHVGEAPYGPMQQAARLRGIEMSDLRARQFSAEDFGVFDLILVMDRTNLEDVEAKRPNGSMTPVRLFAEFASMLACDTVPDPYYSRDFDGCLDLLVQAALGLKEALAQGRLSAG